MAVHFHKLEIKEVRQETPECVSIAFIIPPELKTIFQFEHGQNITIKTNIDNEDIRRSYSICTTALENELRVAVKKAPFGKFSTYANDQLKAGDILEVLPPTGKFNTRLHYENKKRYLAFAAGSGITPILSIVKTTLQSEPHSSFTLVYGNRDRSSIIFFEALESLKNKYIDRLNFINILSREQTDAPINSGRIDTEKLTALKKLIDYRSADETFICGPEEMIFCVKYFLQQQGISENKIHFELFTIPGKKNLSTGSQNTIDKKNETAIGGMNSMVFIKSDGRTFYFSLPFNSIPILDAALQQGADLPFACKGGVCCSCKAKLTEGKVRMDVNYGLEQDEIEQGFILSCQSHPLTEKVVIDFDLK